jgi:hypothetical protein
MIDATIYNKWSSFYKNYSVKDLQLVIKSLSTDKAYNCEIISVVSWMLRAKLLDKAVTNWIYVESDSIHAISRDSVSKTVCVLFRSDLSVAYVYNNIPDDIWVAWLADRSKGKFFHRNIKDKYVSTRRYVTL